jgi:subtilisin family serine protease
MRVRDLASVVVAGAALGAPLPVSATQPGPDPLTAQQQPPKIMRVAKAVASAGKLRQVKVMIPDTGLDLDHPDLSPRLYSLPKPTRAPNQYPGQFPDVTIPAGAHGYDMIGNDCAPPNEAPDLDPSHPPGCSDHGTEVAGILGAAWDNGVGGNGVAPNARFIALRTCWGDDQCYGHIQPPAMEWAAKRGARVISLSWLADRNPDLNRVIKRNPRILFVTIPSGNGGAFNTDPTHPQPCSVDLPNVICASVSTPDDGIDCAAYGPRSVDVAVPTRNSVTTVNGGGFGGTGCATSFASPTVAGVATILFGMAPEATGAQVKRAIIDGARPAKAWRNKSVSGGIVNAASSVRLVKRRF